MAKYIARRVLYMIPTLILISMISFAIIQLPWRLPDDAGRPDVSPGRVGGPVADRDARGSLRIGPPFYVQYWKWISNIVLHGDFGESFEWNRPVSELLAERLPLP